MSHATVAARAHRPAPRPGHPEPTPAEDIAMTAALDPPAAAWGFARRDRDARQSQQARLCSLAAFLRRPEALDCDDAALAARFGVPEREVERAWRRHFGRIDARARAEAARIELSRRPWSPGDAIPADEDGPPRARNVADAVLADRIAARPRPEVDRLRAHEERRAARAARPRDPRRSCHTLVAQFRAVRRRHRRLDWSPAVAS